MYCKNTLTFVILEISRMFALEGLEAPCREGIPLERKIKTYAQRAYARFFFSSLWGYIPLAVRLTPLSLGEMSYAMIFSANFFFLFERFYDYF